MAIWYACDDKELIRLWNGNTPLPQIATAMKRSKGQVEKRANALLERGVIQRRGKLPHTVAVVALSTEQPPFEIMPPVPAMVPQPVDTQPEPETVEEDTATLPTRFRASLVRNHCRWPLWADDAHASGDDRKDFCQHVKAPGKSYCTTHMAAAYRAG